MGTTKLFYDGEGKLIRQENGNGTYATFSYDGAGRLVQIEYRRTSDNSLLSRFVYSYDAAGNKVQVQEEVLQPDGSLSVATVSYGYDQIDRLTSEKRTGSNAYWYEYTYDGSGNRLGMVERDGTGNIVGQKSYSYDSGNKLLQEVANGVTTVYQYDPNGNTISKATGTSQVRYYWDDEDKMVRLEDSVVMNFRTDALGFRRFKEVVGQYQRWFVYDMGASEVPGLAPLVAEYDESGNLVAKYHYDGGGLLAMTRNNQSYWYGFEGIGTTRQLMGSQGQVVDAYAFDAWGNEITNPQSQVPNPFKYVGKHGYYWDTESALMLLGVRYYGAGIGRFISYDPAFDDRNWYIYAKVNPINYIDPKGLWPVYGYATEDRPPNKRYRRTCSGQIVLPDVFCNHSPGNPACPIYRLGMTGSFPNVEINWNFTMTIHCQCRRRRFVCRVRDRRIHQPGLRQTVQCGDWLWVISLINPRCRVRIQIIDAGPGIPGRVIDLHPQPASIFYRCLGIGYGTPTPVEVRP
jgi:RHS repeat-associated protein